MGLNVYVLLGANAAGPHGKAAKSVSLALGRTKVATPQSSDAAQGVHKSEPMSVSRALERHELPLLSTRGSAADSPAVLLTAAVTAWEDVATVEDQAVGVVARVRRRGPIVAVRATSAHRAAVNVARINEVVWIGSELFASICVCDICIIINFII